jgi:hypothetical protein
LASRTDPERSNAYLPALRKARGRIVQVSAPSRAPVGENAEEMLRLAHEKSDAELDALRLQIVGLS